MRHAHLALLCLLLIGGCGSGGPPVDALREGLTNAGGACTSNSNCKSGICLGGFCCGSSCVTGGTCGASACAQHSGACVYPTSATSCRTASCANGVATAAASCNGAGSCPTATTTNCSPYVCGATACKTTCAADSDCVAADYCSGTTCAARAAAGAACAANNACLSGACLGGFCCGAACVTGGACGASACASGSGACVYPSSQCVAASCTGGVATAAANCSGGSCPTATTTNCAPFTCGATACNTTCAADGDCAAGAYCNGGACAYKVAAGGNCGGNNACLSGACLGGVCCGAACVTGGACGASACASGSGACVYPTGQCVAAACANGVVTAAASCDGAGNCPTPSTTNCAPYGCNGAVCATTCAGNADCAPGNACAGGVCKRLPQPGCDQFPNLVSLDPTVAHCVGNCCSYHDKCYYDNDCLNGGAGSPACAQCDDLANRCAGICRMGALDCSHMICGCGQSRCFDYQCDAGHAGEGYCAPSCAVTSASPCRPQHPGEIMTGGTAQTQNAGYNMNMGYKFTPTAAASATQLGGFYNGTKIVRLYSNPLSLFTGTVIAQATNTSANAFSYTPITPVALSAGALYGVAADMAGSGTAYTPLALPDGTLYGKTTVNCPAYGLAGGIPYSCSTPYYYGMGDVELVY